MSETGVTVVGNEIEVRSKVWLERAGGVVVSGWRISLLVEIQATGSLAAACERLNVPYRTAWYKLKEMEEQLGVKLVDTQSGGASGGGSRLTREAEDLVGRFQRAYAGVEAMVAERFAAEFGDWDSGVV